MKILNKFIWSKKEPSNKNDIWFDGSTWKMYTEEAWQSFTLSVDDADKVAKVLENASEVYQEKLNAGYGIVIDGNTISLDVSSIDVNATYNIGSIQIFDDVISSQNTYYLTTEDIEAIKGGKLITTTHGDMTIPAFGVSGGGSIIHMYFYAESKLYDIGIVDDGVTPCIFPYFCKKVDILLYKDDFLSEISENSVQNKVITAELNKKLNKTDVATINGQSLTGGGNIVIPTGESYDDTEIKQQITELSAETEVLKEAQQFTDVAVKDLQDMKIDRENDDYYPKMAVGTADNLAGVDVVDSEINFRRSGGGAITDGVARIETIKGNSVVWNQLVTIGTNKTQTKEGVSLVDNRDGSYTISGENTSSADVRIVLYTNYSVRGGHKAMLIGAPLSSSNTTFYLEEGYTGYRDVGKGVIFSLSSANGASTTAVVKPGAVISSATYRPLLFDLTQMFGAGNEPTTIEEFYQRIPMGVDMNAYNEGTIYNMKATGIKSVGVNQWDEQWELGTIANATGENANDSSRIRSKNFIPIFPSTDYYCYYGEDAGAKHIYAFFYDKGKNFISGGARISGKVFTTPSNAHYLRISNYGAAMTTYKGDICIGIKGDWTGYQPYMEASEDLSLVVKYFPDGMRSAGAAHDEIRDNKASGKREYSKGRMKAVDMGSLNWTYNPTEGQKRFISYGTEGEAAPPKNADSVANILCTKYETTSFNTLFVNARDRLVALNQTGIVAVYDSAYTDAASFKAAMQGVILYYEAAEWEWVELDAEDQSINLDYKVWNCGTEQMEATEPSAPLAADITYGFNAVGLIKQIKAALQAAGLM